MFRALLLVSLYVATGSQASAELYKWIDEKGVVHFSDSVPEEYRASVEQVQVDTSQPSAEERQEAKAIVERAERAADDVRRLRLETEESHAPESLAERKGGGKTQEPPVIAPKPGQARLTRAERMAIYRAKMEEYRKSQDCFAKYQTLGGGTRGYAFNECKSVPQPRITDYE
ncbi:hypothetical protein RE428_33650 [Marinobacter nanhaiticus D15-8W]|nr:DUF4124 domain-containing protein [Marinobacter nanhaiticus]BES72347.1 hypothetical protein RE428_33650 [Marinobacter nanhaiticus D15-8W]